MDIQKVKLRTFQQFSTDYKFQLTTYRAVWLKIQKISHFAKLKTVLMILRID